MPKRDTVSVQDAWRRWTIERLTESERVVYIGSIVVEHGDDTRDRVSFRVYDASDLTDLGYAECGKMYLTRVFIRIAEHVDPDKLIGPLRFIRYKNTYSIEDAGLPT